ncbi:MAG: serine hydrolase domain-containing protein [Pseudomonadota bacterium]
MSRALEAEGITGAVWGTLDERGNVRTEAARLAAKGREMRPDDRVQVGSIGKAVLATGILRLVTEGRVELDTPVTELIPGLALDNPWAATHPVRLRHLLDHTAGLNDMRLWQLFSSKARADTPLARATDIGRPLEVRTRPGSRYSYSNVGYGLAARVIEQVTGQRYEHYLDTHLLAPLGMHNSTFRYVTQVGAAADPRLAMGHFDNNEAQPAIPLHLRPAGQFTTTSADMLRFAAFLMSDGRIDGQPFIAPALMRARGRATGTEAARAGLRVGYALGMTLRDRHGAVGLCHGGDAVGFRAMLCSYPEHHRAFFVAFNADVEGADYAGLREKLVRALGVASAGVAPVAAVTADLDEWTGFYVRAPSRFEGFAWVDTVFGFVRATREGSGLRLSGLQSKPVSLVPVGGGLFREPDRILASHVTAIGDDGARIIASSEQTYARVPVVRLVALWASFSIALLGLIYIALIGLARIVRRRPGKTDALRLPWIALVALALPPPFLARQSFMQIADVTTGSVLLAVVTGMLPIALIAGLVRAAPAAAGKRAWMDSVALAALLQGLAVLAAWGLIPLRTWAL